MHADLGDLDRQPARPFEVRARSTAHADEDAKALLGDESAVAEEGELARLAREVQRADLQFRADRHEADQLLVIGSPGVERQAHTLQLEDRADIDLERVEFEDEAVDHTIGEGQAGLQRERVVHVLARDAVGDLGVDRLARREGRPARADIDRAVEGHVLTEDQREIGDADAQVVKFEDRAELDLARRAVGALDRARAGARARAGTRIDDLAAPDAEAVVVDRETAHALKGRDLARNAEFREGDLDRVDLDDLLPRAFRRARDRGIGRRPRGIVFDLDAVGLEEDHIGDRASQLVGGDRPFAGERDDRAVRLAGDDAHHVDADIELHQQVGQGDLSATAIGLGAVGILRRGAAEGERGAFRPD